MITFSQYQLDNGLTVIHHQDKTTAMSAVNVLYKVGSRNEDPSKTGLAHFFEHLMFSGSQNVPQFDIPLQNAGGENNAFTNSDITNYYDMVPASNIDTALWLEADRMQNLTLSEHNIETQRKVVIEEFKETCLNRPYGDSWHTITGMAYQTYPYMWPTIGKEISHIENFTDNDIWSFYKDYYQPKNAILSIVSPHDDTFVKQRVAHWFSEVQGVDIAPWQDVVEAHLTENVHKTITAPVSAKRIYFVFKMPARSHKDYYVYDLLSDILGYGASSRFYHQLVKTTGKFTQLSAYISGSVGPGLFIIDGKIADSTTTEEAEALIWNQLNTLIEKSISYRELQKVKNKIVSSLKFGDVSILNKAMNLAYFASIGDANLINSEEEKYEAVTVEDIQRVSNEMFREQKHCKLVYLPK